MQIKTNTTGAKSKLRELYRTSRKKLQQLNKQKKADSKLFSKKEEEGGFCSVCKFKTTHYTISLDYNLKSMREVYDLLCDNCKPKYLEAHGIKDDGLQGNN